jgi:hypothetical protein
LAKARELKLLKETRPPEDLLKTAERMVLMERLALSCMGQIADLQEEGGVMDVVPMPLNSVWNTLLRFNLAATAAVVIPTVQAMTQWAWS